jgi:hypothetical protein
MTPYFVGGVIGAVGTLAAIYIWIIWDELFPPRYTR